MAGWPPLPFDAWRSTYATLHRCAQVVGKIQLALTPLSNHYWNVAFQLSARGLTTPALPVGDRQLELELDFVDHLLVLRTSDGARRALPFLARPVASFYEELMTLLAALGVAVTLDDRPVELQSEAIPFHDDRLHAAYDPRWASRCWQIIARSAAVLQEFRAHFLGKCSPVHFFWGSFDLAVSRFSGRRAPVRPDADQVTREAYSHEVSSVGFWPGDERFRAPAFYAYHAPPPPGFEDGRVRPAGAFWHRGLSEYLLPYDEVRQAHDPRAAILEFAQSTYELGADLAFWDRAELERQPLEDEFREEAPVAQPAHPPPVHPT